MYYDMCVIYAVCDKASKQCDRYSHTKGAGTLAYPERHPFFQKLGPMVKLHLEKSTRENGFMYVRLFTVYTTLHVSCCV